MNPDPATEKAINETLAEWAFAVQRADLDTIASLVTKDAEFWTHGAPPLCGRQALKLALEPFFAQYEMHQDFHCQEMLIFKDHALMRGLEVNRLVPLNGGEEMEVKQRAFSVLRRGLDGKWRFARGITNLPPEEDASSKHESAV